MPAVGVVAIQGDFAKHLEALERCGHQGLEVRTPGDLAKVDRLIIPGGESTTVGKLMDRYGLGAEILRIAASGIPIWGTCMGMILLARDVEGHDQYRLGLLDILVRRNAFGSQTHSFEDTVSLSVLDQPLCAVFIRAPIVVSWGPEVQVMGRYGESVVAVRQGNVIGTSFHPELTEDVRLHQWFLNLN